MAHIKIKKGLDIPIEGNPEGEVQPLPVPQNIALNLSSFEHTKFKLLAKEGEQVKIGQPLVADKEHEGVVFTSPAAGTVKTVMRGLKRRLLNIVIEKAQKEEYHEEKTFNLNAGSRDDLVEYMKNSGLFPYLRQRPFNLAADPTKTPRAIFVKAIESAPFLPPAEMQVKGHEKEFALGLETLSKLTEGEVHLVHAKGSSFSPFTNAEHVVKHTAEGPHPIGNSSVHIHFISPIQSVDEVVWTVTALDVVRIGHQVMHGKPLLERVISIAGPGVLDGKRGYFRVRDGYPVGALVANRVPKGYYRFVSGDLLTGEQVSIEEYLGFYHTCFNVLQENTERELLHFFRLGINKYSATKAYLSGHLNNSDRRYDFTTSTHGEERAFVTNMPYDAVMPMRIPTMTLVKAIMAEDFDQAEEYGLLEVDSEDFALATFVCPSKIEISEVVKEGLHNYALDVVH